MISIAQPFEKYLRIFQAEGPLVHCLFVEQVFLLRTIMMRFLKKEVITGLTATQLAKLDIEKDSNALDDLKMMIGHETDAALRNIECKKTKTVYLKRLRKSYTEVVHYLQKKLPLNSQFLRDVSCLNTSNRQSERTVNAIGQIAQCMPHFLSPQEVGIVRDEWRLYQIDNDIKPEWIQEFSNERIDYFWRKVFELHASGGGKKYAMLRKAVKSALSVHNGNSDVERSYL